MPRDKKTFIVDERGRKKAVVLPIREYNALLEDLEDLAIMAERKDEPTEPFEVVRKRLQRKWGTLEFEQAES